VGWGLGWAGYGVFGSGLNLGSLSLRRQIKTGDEDLRSRLEVQSNRQAAKGAKRDDEGRADGNGYRFSVIGGTEIRTPQAAILIMASRVAVGTEPDPPDIEKTAVFRTGGTTSVSSVTVQVAIVRIAVWLILLAGLREKGGRGSGRWQGVGRQEGGVA
jgi:hypothetical protein